MVTLTSANGTVIGALGLCTVTVTPWTAGWSAITASAMRAASRSIKSTCSPSMTDYDPFGDAPVINRVMQVIAGTGTCRSRCSTASTMKVRGAGARSPARRACPCLERRVRRIVSTVASFRLGWWWVTTPVSFADGPPAEGGGLVLVLSPEGADCQGGAAAAHGSKAVLHRRRDRAPDNTSHTAGRPDGTAKGCRAHCAPAV